MKGRKKKWGCALILIIVVPVVIFGWSLLDEIHSSTSCKLSGMRHCLFERNELPVATYQQGRETAAVVELCE